MQHRADVSVVIPVKNESAGLAACLSGILRQTVKVREIIVIDSGSTDGTQGIARGFDKVRLIEISPAEFNHGETRNLGWREANGDYVLFTVGDARPVDDRWIEELLNGFVADDVVAVCGAQVVPHERQANPIDWFRPVSKPTIKTVRFTSTQAFDAASSVDRVTACALDDVTAIYRRTALAEIGFRRLVYGEDLLFAYDAYQACKAISFNPAARVYHYHIESYQSVLKRTVAVCSLKYRLFGYRYAPLPYYGRLPRYAVRLALERGMTLPDRLRWLRYNERLLAAMHRGVLLVNEAARAGDEALAALHDKYCGTPPIPLRRTS